jgi:Holliday junction resolvase RusA-like endonuclease
MGNLERLLITIPGKPGHWRRARVSTRSGRPIQFTDAKTRDWEETVATYARAQWVGEPIDVPCSLSVTILLSVPESKAGLRKWLKDRGLASVPERHPHGSTPDLDNFVKGILDGLTKSGIWLDDRLVARIDATKWWCQPGQERCEIDVAEIMEVSQ